MKFIFNELLQIKFKLSEKKMKALKGGKNFWFGMALR